MPSTTTTAARFAVAVLGILLVVSTGAAATAPAPVSAGPPADYTQTRGLSEPVHDPLPTEVVLLEMRDGIEIYIEITRPDTDEPVPVILEASPYHGTIADRLGTRIFPDPVDDDGNLVGLVGYFVPRGYAVAMMGLRGTGRSQGCLDHMGQNDARDMKEVIEWLERQDWSNGRIGMTGHSYVGSTPKIAAAQNPKGLVTIVPSAGIARAYDHQFQHGVAYTGQWLGLPVAYNVLAMDRHLPEQAFDPVMGGDTGDNFGNDMQYFGCGWTTSSLQDGHRQVTGEYSAFHAQRDHTAGATQAEIPVFLIQGVYDVAVRPPAMDWFNQRRNPQDKLWYGQFDHGSGSHVNRRGWQWVTALHAWFDHHLQERMVELLDDEGNVVLDDEGNPVMVPIDTGPPVEVFLNDSLTQAGAIPAHEEVLTADVWPPPARTVELFPDADGSMSTTRPTDADAVTFSSLPFAGRGSATFTTGAFAEETLLVGLPSLRLYGSFTAQHLDLIVTVSSVDPSGFFRRQINRFAMNPALRDSIGHAQPVVPGQVYELNPPGWPMAYKVPEGHRLEVRVATTHPDHMALKPDDPQVTIYTGGSFPTSLRLPVIDAPVLHDDVLRDQ